MILESGADVPRPKQRRGPSTRAGSIRSTVRQSHSAKMRLVQLAYLGCPWREVGVGQRCRRSDPGPGSYRAEPIPGKCLGDLACNPLRCRVGCDVDPYEISAMKPHNHEAVN